MSGQLKGGAATLLDLQWFWVLAIIILVGAVFTVVCPPGTFLTVFNL
jgi:hypothetical protein